MKHASKEKSFERRVFESLYGSSDFDEGINNALALIGNEFHISRAYIFENSEDNKYGDNTYEWCASGIVPQMNELQNMSYEEYGYDKLFEESGAFICSNIALLPDIQRELLESQSIRAILQYALYDKDEFCGFVGFDDCNSIRLDWGDEGEELDALIFLSQLLSVYLVKERNLRKANHYQEQMQNALEYEKLFNKLAIGVGIYEIRDGIIQSRYLNDGYYRMLHTDKKRRSKFHGENTILAVCDEDCEGLYAVAEEAIASGNIIDHKFRVLNGEGEYSWLNIIGNVYLEEGIPVFYVSFTDVTEQLCQKNEVQAKYEQQLQYVEMLSSDAMASSMVNLTRNVICQQRTADGPILEVITQQTPQEGFELMYTHIPDLEIREQYKNIFDRNIIIDNLRKGINSKSIIHPQDTFNVWLESGYIAVENPDNGDIEAYCYAKDVTDSVLQNNISKLLMEREYEAVALLNIHSGKPEKVIVQPFGYSVLSFSKRSEKMSIEAIKDALDKEVSHSVLFSIGSQNESIRRKKALFMYVDKYQSAILCLVQDVTADFESEIRQREKLQNALDSAQKAKKAKAEFYSQMSHDMRTPMNGILGITELALEEKDPVKLYGDLEKIRQSGIYMLNLINDTLDYQRLETGKMKLEPQIVRCNDVFEEAIMMLSPAIQEKKQNFKITVLEGSELNWYVRIDALRLKQVAMNILSNAVKYTPSGGTIELCVGELQREGMVSHDLIRISDNGVGMSEHFLKNGLFKPFSQERNEMSSKYPGSGLGLSIVKKLIALMGGRIEVESQLGVGTVFSLYLDMDMLTDQEAEKLLNIRKMNVTETFNSLKGHRFLVCEDHPLNAEITQRLLEKAGCQADLAENGKKGVALLEKSISGYYDAVLMDIRMPIMNGLEAANAIRLLDHPDAKTIPIIAMSANAYREDIQKSKEAGMNAHLAKPVNPQELFATLTKFLKGVK